jgi:hypothetical protein
MQENASQIAITKHTLINPLGAEVDESADLIRDPQAALPYKISRFLRGSLVQKLL